MAKPRTRWTPAQKKEFKKWHDGRLKEIGYPEQVKKELSRTCDRWLGQVPAVKEPAPTGE